MTGLFPSFIESIESIRSIEKREALRDAGAEVSAAIVVQLLRAVRKDMSEEAVRGYRDQSQCTGLQPGGEAIAHASSSPCPVAPGGSM
ncbi:hypothetical protein ACFWOJ_06680 [Streptomyces sp. NPDC058439]|uniref:hypothetical protein n=1 Tax=Streptomyces sp. NPDC058439 TaxID=3346500 RepID=UPI00365E1DA0